MTQQSSHTPVPPVDSSNAPPETWSEALACLISSRVAIFQAESKAASRETFQRLLFLIIAGLCALFAWALLVISIIAALVAVNGWPWYWVTLGACGMHFILAVILILRAKSAGQDHFSITRSEFLKDREWLKNLQKRTSKN